MKSFEKDNTKLDMGSGYDRKRHQPAANESMTYWIVIKDGKPVDLVRENTSRKTAVSVVDTRLEKHHKRKQRQMPSVYWPRTVEDGLNFVELDEFQFHGVLSDRSTMTKLFEARNPLARARYSDETKQAVIEARLSGSKWPAIVSQYGVARSTAQYWVEKHLSDFAAKAEAAEVKS